MISDFYSASPHYFDLNRQQMFALEETGWSEMNLCKSPQVYLRCTGTHLGPEVTDWQWRPFGAHPRRSQGKPDLQ